MCGICGLSAPNFAQRAATVAKMNEALIHRGPNDAGQFDGATASIAMRRLCIIDLHTGHQPIANEDASLQIVFNGEIYNYLELREKLQATGRHVFKTASDTEVILHLYEEYGADAPKYLQGMFAFCIYDTKNESLFLARDRFGEKPLFYFAQQNNFAFSSEVASLLAHEKIERKLDVEALSYYLHVGYCPTPLTMLQHVKELPAGHWLRWQNGDLKIGAYYQPEYQPDPALQNEADAVEAVRTTLLSAVKRQMVSDVPLGAFLSGGIDSSAVVAAMQQQSRQKIKTFTVRFEHAAFDESKIAREVANHLGTDHHEFVVTNGGFADEDLWRTLRHVGQPFVDSSSIPTFVLSNHVKDHVTVSLSGDGGDEMFAGYRVYQACLGVDQIADYVPHVLLAATSKALHKVANSPRTAQLQILAKIMRVSSAACLSRQDRTWRMGPLFDEGTMQEMASPWLREKWQQTTKDAVQKLLGTQANMTRLRQVMDSRLRYFLPSDMLVKVDRMSMAASLEVRAPMLDAEMAALSMRLPDNLLIRDGVTKYILRQAIRPWLPDSVFSHPKWGFTIPLHLFQNKNYQTLCEDLLLNSKHEIINQLFSKPALTAIIQRGLNQNYGGGDIAAFNASQQVWALLNLAGWAELFAITL